MGSNELTPNNGSGDHWGIPNLYGLLSHTSPPHDPACWRPWPLFPWLSHFLALCPLWVSRPSYGWQRADRTAGNGTMGPAEPPGRGEGEGGGNMANLLNLH